MSASKLTGILSLTNIPNLSSSYAALNSGKISLDVIPDLSSNYAPLSLDKISMTHLPDLSSLYSRTDHTHTANALGAISESSGVIDSGKLIKLNSSGKISSSNIETMGIPTIFLESGHVYGTFMGLPQTNNDELNGSYLIFLADGSHYIMSNKTL